MSETGPAAREPEGATAAAEGMKAWSWAAFNSTYLPALILAMGTGIAVPSIPAIAQSFHVGFAVATGITTSFLIGNVAGALPAGWLIDRFGRRRVMLMGPILTAVMAFAVVFAHTYPELLALRFADGFAAQLWLMGRLAGISHGSAPEQRGRQVSWMFGMDNTGRALGPLIGGVMATSWGIRSPFVAYGALALLALVPAYRYIQDTPRREVAPADGAATETSTTSTTTSARPFTYRRLLATRTNYFAIAFFAACARGPIQASLLNLYAAFRYHLKPDQIGFLASGAAFIMLPIGFVAGWAMDRFGRKRTMVPGFGGVALTMTGLALTAIFNMTVAVYVTIFLFTAFAQGITGGSIQTVGADVAPPEARGMFLGLWRFVGQGGVALSPVIFASLATVSYAASFLFVGASGGIVALIVAFKVPETGGKRALAERAMANGSAIKSA
ncbi:MAG TPA: MFS transporter [Acidimicrobiales bacterium]|nr:MFS transporter [Acidimicrobiales bacterium]